MQQREGGQQMRDIALATRIYFAADADRRKTTRSTAAPPLYRPQKTRHLPHRHQLTWKSTEPCRGDGTHGSQRKISRNPNLTEMSVSTQTHVLIALGSALAGRGF